MENNHLEIKLMTAEETSAKFFAGKKSYGAMVAAARKKQLPSVRIGNRIYFEENSLQKFFAQQLALSASEMNCAAKTKTQQRIEKVAGIKRIE